jgi:hypothetical protein
MITLTREEAQQVLDVLKDINKLSVGVNAIFLPAEIDEVMETLRTELTKPEPEPVAWTVGGLITDFSRDFSAYKTKTYTQPLYTTPPQRKECLRCGKVNPADIHTCTPMTVKNIQTSDKNA